MNQLLILTSCAKFELDSLRNNEIATTDVFRCRDIWRVRNDVMLNNGYDVMNCFAKFENSLPRKFYDCRRLNARVSLAGGGGGG